MSSRRTRENLKLSLALAVLASTFQLACSKNEDPQAIKTAPPSALATHLRTCATQVKGSGHVVVRKAVSVCRKNAEDGTLQDVAFEPRYLMRHSSSRRIELQQTVAIRLEDKSEKPTEAKSPERSLIDQKVVQFVAETCRPVIDQIFRRSGLRAEHQFRMLLENDAFEPSGPIQTEKPGQGAQATQTSAKTPSASASNPAVRGMHLLLDLEFSLEKGIVLKDDPATTYSGSISSEVTPELKASHLQFCGQIAMRVAENYGLTNGRDCQSLAKISEENSVEKVENKASHVGLMKPGRTVEDLSKVKLASDEIDEVFFPLCGKMPKTLQQR